jgi:hypothetical protein
LAIPRTVNIPNETPSINNNTNSAMCFLFK